MQHYRGVQLFAPTGISYKPTDGENLLIIPINGSATAVGSLAQNNNLKQGELLLKSAGGAYIKLKSDGSISLNGLIISNKGEVL